MPNIIKEIIAKGLPSLCTKYIFDSFDNPIDSHNVFSTKYINNLDDINNFDFSIAYQDLKLPQFCVDAFTREATGEILCLKNHERFRHSNKAFVELALYISLFLIKDIINEYIIKIDYVNSESKIQSDKNICSGDVKKLYLSEWPVISYTFSENHENNAFDDCSYLVLPFFEQLYLGIIPPKENRALVNSPNSLKRCIGLTRQDEDKIPLKTLIETHQIDLIKLILICESMIFPTQMLSRIKIDENKLRREYTLFSSKTLKDYNIRLNEVPQIQISGEWSTELHGELEFISKDVDDDYFILDMNKNGWGIKFLTQPKKSMDFKISIRIKVANQSLLHEVINLNYEFLKNNIIHCYAETSNQKKIEATWSTQYYKLCLWTEAYTLGKEVVQTTANLLHFKEYGIALNFNVFYLDERYEKFKSVYSTYIEGDNKFNLLSKDLKYYFIKLSSTKSKTFCIDLTSNEGADESKKNRFRDIFSKLEEVKEYYQQRPSPTVELDGEQSEKDMKEVPTAADTKELNCEEDVNTYIKKWKNLERTYQKEEEVKKCQCCRAAQQLLDPDNKITGVNIFISIWTEEKDYNPSRSKWAESKKLEINELAKIHDLPPMPKNRNRRK